MKRKILIVEDDLRNLKLMRALLTVSGYTIIGARDGQQGILSAREERPDLILMDMQLPVLNGFEAVRQLKADPGTRDIPVLAVTALAMKGDRERVLETGADGYVSKPVRLEEVLQQIDLHLSERTEA